MLNRKPRILIIDDDKGVQIATKYILKDTYDCASAYTSDEAKIILEAQAFDLALLDLKMKTPNEGFELLPQLKEIDSELDIVVVSGNAELNSASKATMLGASAYLIKGHSVEQLKITIESVLSRRTIAAENRHYVRDRQRLLEKNKIIGKSLAIKQLLRDVEKIQRSQANVIIVAETGSGKELVARHIGAVEGKPFVAVDSATITSSMAESILFGHEKGAFTGAHAQSKGLFEEANGGTIYFDEIANMPLEIQAKLLRVVQEKEIVRVGSTKPIPLEFRVICATNKDLSKLCQEGRFKDDLFQRLNVISVRIPPLRERSEDIPLLISHFLERYRQDETPGALSNEALERLMGYAWPGNVRELSNTVANLCTMAADQETIEVEDLPERMRSCMAAGSVTPTQPVPISVATTDHSFYDHLRNYERQLLVRFHAEHKGNISRMSRSLKMSRTHLYSKLNAHGIVRT